MIIYLDFVSNSIILDSYLVEYVNQSFIPYLLQATLRWNIFIARYI